MNSFQLRANFSASAAWIEVHKLSSIWFILGDLILPLPEYIVSICAAYTVHVSELQQCSCVKHAVFLLRCVNTVCLHKVFFFLSARSEKYTSVSMNPLFQWREKMWKGKSKNTGLVIVQVRCIVSTKTIPVIDILSCNSKVQYSFMNEK